MGGGEGRERGRTARFMQATLSATLCTLHAALPCLGACCGLKAANGSQLLPTGPKSCAALS